MRNVTTLETDLTAGCLRLAFDFAREIIEEWKAWLTGSIPMAGIAILSLVDPEWVRLPIWTWAILIFVAGLVFAMFRVYRDLRWQRDTLDDQVAGIAIAGPFILVPFYGNRACGLAKHTSSERDYDL